jgi:hypothetical protein
MTVAPASEKLSVRIVLSEALAVGAPVRDLLTLLDSAAIENLALCTHGETLAALSREWAATWPGASAPQNLSDTPKGGSWVIENYGTLAASARYLGVPETNQGLLPLAN